LALSTGRLGVSKSFDSLLSAAHLSNWATRHNIAASGTSDIRFKLYERSIAFLFQPHGLGVTLYFLVFFFQWLSKERSRLTPNFFYIVGDKVLGPASVQAHEFMVHASDGG
jgi:hypothetical protein